MFEHFREEFVPECDSLDGQLDIFNTAEDPAKKDETLF